MILTLFIPLEKRLFASEQQYLFSITDTGQTICYNNSEEIICPNRNESFFGQDASYLINPLSYAKLDYHGNELPYTATEWVMVKDNVTGLIWEVKTEDKSIQDKDNLFTWYNSNSGSNIGNVDGASIEDYIDYLNYNHFGSFSDWRIPTLKELEQIVNMNQLFPAIDTRFFPNTVSGFYWSSTTYHPANERAFGINFINGNDGNDDKTSAYYIRAVRGGKVSPKYRWAINNDGTATDTWHGLMWKIHNSETSASWQGAISNCEALVFAGYDDWRLPSKKILRTIVNYSISLPAVYPVFEDTPNEFFWSSSNDSSDPEYAWGIFFDEGYDLNLPKNRSFTYRAVRGGQNIIENHLIIYSPNQGGNYKIGDIVPIQWNPQSIQGNVSILISRQGGISGSYKTLVDATENDGRYEWQCAGPASYNCMIKIVPMSEPENETTQGLFSITDDTPPKLSEISDILLNSNSQTNPILFSVSDNDKGSISVIASSSNLNLIKPENIDITGKNPSYYTIINLENGKQYLPLIITPELNQTGSATIILTAFDAGFLSCTTSFVLSVTETNAPTISTINQQSTAVDTPLTLIFYVNSQTSSPQQLTVNARSSNDVLVPNDGSHMLLFAKDSEQKLVIYPQTGSYGDTIISITVSDSFGLSNSTEFLLVVEQFFTISAIADIGGSIAPSGNNTVRIGENQIFWIQPDSNYIIDAFIVDGNNTQLTSNQYVFHHISSDHNIYVRFKLKNYIIKSQAGKNGSIIPAGNILLQHGEDQAFEIVANENYISEKIIIDGIEFTGNYNDYTFFNVSENHEISVLFMRAKENTLPDLPDLIFPDHEDLLNTNSITFQTGSYHDVDNDPHICTYWEIRSFDKPYQCQDFNSSFCFKGSGVNLNSYEINGLQTGMKYAWRAAYSDTCDDLPLFSEEKTFIIGQPYEDENVSIQQSIDPKQFKMVSFVQWPEEPFAIDALRNGMNGEYDTNYFRIASYDPTYKTGGYIECDNDLKIIPGRSYWMLARNGMKCKIRGVRVSTKDAFFVPLLYNAEDENGWNMIACPNARNYSWNNIHVVSYDDNGNMIDEFGQIISLDQIKTISELEEGNPLIDKNLWTWENGQHVLLNPDRGTGAVLYKYEGYWVKARQSNVYLSFSEEASVTDTIDRKRTTTSLNTIEQNIEYPPVPVSGFSDNNTSISNCFVGIIFIPLSGFQRFEMLFNSIGFVFIFIILLINLNKRRNMRLHDQMSF